MNLKEFRKYVNETLDKIEEETPLAENIQVVGWTHHYRWMTPKCVEGCLDLQKITHEALIRTLRDVPADYPSQAGYVLVVDIV